MKTLSSALQAHLDTGVTTLAYCWKVTRTDGTVYGFTEHDRDITALGTTFSAETGFTASQIEQGLGLSIDNLEATGALSSASLNDADILAGRFDDATVELYWINWQDPTQIVVIAQGNLGEIKRQGAPSRRNSARSRIASTRRSARPMSGAVRRPWATRAAAST